MAVSESIHVDARAVAKDDDVDDGARGRLFDGRLVMLLSSLLQNRYHDQTLLIVIDVADATVTLMVGGDGVPLCLHRA